MIKAWSYIYIFKCAVVQNNWVSGTVSNLSKKKKNSYVKCSNGKQLIKRFRSKSSCEQHDKLKQ